MTMNSFFKTTIFLLAIFSASNACATSTIDIMEKYFADGNEAYESGDYELAAEIYCKIIDEGFTSWQLYYNLGNTYYRLDEIGRSILNYERALRLAPNKQVVKDNLALASSKTVDNIEELPRMFLVEWTQAIVQLTTPLGWRVIVIILMVLLCAAGCLFFTAQSYKLRKIMFIVGSVLLVLTIISGIDAAISTKNATNRNRAVILEPMVVVKGSPDAKSVDKFILHEGTRVNITDRQDSWWQIEIADGKSGWIESGAEII